MSVARTASRIDYIDVPPASRRIELSEGEEDGEVADQQDDVEAEHGAGGDASEAVDDSQEAETSAAGKRRSRPTPTRKSAAKARTRKGGASRAPSTRKRTTPRKVAPKPKDGKSNASETSATNTASEMELQQVEAALQLWSPDTPTVYGLDPSTVEHLNPVVVAQSVRSSLDRNRFVVDGDEETHRQLILKATIAACVATCITRAN
ncbi:hypothetical protein CF319_g6176 [Tilletia indica]|uniref:Uncharacterized protein n=1 Tax=Tilletia indica TaxID=43049 RepID=A0A177TET3_9BASI|nr:hypothetical protein CF319_g6176 [Tilletia indica]KAE8221817.1 hypothetical protein CF326_g8491 [Tilletia indica]KAE8249626.1 hypothetical protein A4X13_0g5135 [Tilletia indica]